MTMQKLGIGSLVVEDGKEVKGLITERSFLPFVEKNFAGHVMEQRTVGDTLQGHRVCYLSMQHTLSELVASFCTPLCGYDTSLYIPIVGAVGNTEDLDYRVVGVISARDCLNALLQRPRCFSHETFQSSKVNLRHINSSHTVHTLP